MGKHKLFGKDFICTQDWKIEELDEILNLAFEMKANRYNHALSKCIENKTFFMFFYNPSVRTRQSFECAATELGGHAQFLEPSGMRLKTKTSAGESTEDAAKVMARYAAGMGIRILENKVERYGDGNDLLREYAKYADMPIINMADDKFHPCQGMADVMGMLMHLVKPGMDHNGYPLKRSGKELKGKKLLQVWGQGALARSWCSVQESLLVNSRYGMDVTLAYPEGYDLDPEVIENARKNAEAAGSKFEITHNLKEAYEGVDIVYSRNWMTNQAYEEDGLNKPKEIEKALKFPEWICSEKLMKLTNNAYFIHPMPIDRGYEVEDAVANGPRSIIYDVAEYRLHVQKAIMALTMGDTWW